MSTLWQDVRYGARVLWKSPGFTLMIVCALALGIGANTAIFSVVNAVLLRPLPYAGADRLVWVESRNPPKGIMSSNSSPPDFADWRARTQTFEGLAAFISGGVVLTGGDDPERVATGAVTANFFDVFAARPVHGRTFSADEDKPGAEPVAVLSHALWQRRFGGDPNIVGSKLSLNAKPVTVVGVIEPEFDYPRQAALWVNLAVDAAAERRDNRHLQVIGRLREGATIEEAQAELDVVMRALAADNFETNAGWDVRLVGLQEQIVGGIRPALVLLLGAVGFVLLITCANVANLLLARAASRRREIAVRAALGASRSRITRQLLTESMLLSLIGGALGLLLSVWLTELLVALSPANAPRFDEIAIDPRVLLFTLGVTCAVGVAFGLAPAWQTSRVDLTESLKEGAHGAAEGWRRNRLRRLLVVSEVALSLVLLVGAGLMIRSFMRLGEVEPGFDPSHVLTARVGLPATKFPDPRQRAEFFKRLNEKLETLPGVEAAGATLSLPLRGSNYSVGRGFIPEGRPQTPDESINASYVVVAGEYFRAMRIPLKAGRLFDERDDAEGATHVAIISETTARRHFAGQDPVGRKLHLWRDSKVPNEIVGVVGDTKTQGLEGDFGAQVYVPYAQDTGWSALSLTVRTSVEPTSLAPALRDAVRSLDRELPAYDVKTMDDVVASSVADRRASTLLLSVFAGVAVLVAGLGIYGVISYSVAQRTHEIGIRMALGAQGRDVFSLVVGQGLSLVAVGVVVGVGAALLLTHLMRSMLYGVSATDPWTFAGVAAVLVGVALLACVVPARRATRVDPVIALRYE
ncbi:MAG TPA: ABC transporter permease [Pyrinomonadaceae bacterium]|nr:ABC transporter permease [Pyrinomonadaceae bacterium]